MENILIQIVLLLFLARLFGELAAFFKTPAVIGELLAGILIGPSVLGALTASPPIQLLAQIGIILLLFEVGLETDMGKLTAAGGKALLVAIAGVILPFVLGFWISLSFFHLPLLIALFIASTLTATSIGITLRVLRDLKKQNSMESEIILGAAVLDDIIGIALLATLYEFSTAGSINFWSVGKVLFSILLFFLIAPFAARVASLLIEKWNLKSEIPGLLPTTIVSLILLFAWIAHTLGAPELLGGFAAGLAMSKKFFKSSASFSRLVEIQMRPIIHLFSPIFFVTIGLSLDLGTIAWDSSFIWMLTALLLIAAVVGKLLSGFFSLREKLRSRLLIGTSMIPRGEVGLIFANIGLSLGVFQSEIYASLILVIAITTLLTPFALRWLWR